ncbi:IclR family transcriptional regulator [Halosimplex sp. TS25]|uniref:IclR family transcriptional regulator n=1 Tax=Halosimplex rarum TaxID=3396619 RepID=UPI0039E8D549
MTERARHPVKALEKTVGVIEILTEQRSAHLREIAAELDMNKSTVHNHLSTLREHEYVVKDGDAYELSLQFLTIGGTLRDDVDLFEAAKPKVDDLAADSGELVTLATHERGLGVVLYRAKGEDAVELDTHIGTQLTLHNSALGKAILGHLPRERARAILDEKGLPAETPNTITDEETMLAELEDVAADGYAYDDEERWRGLRCVAAPVRTEDGVVKGAISVSTPKSRMASDADKQEYADAVKNTANLVELGMAYS